MLETLEKTNGLKTVKLWKKTLGFWKFRPKSAEMKVLPKTL